jgi:hypothetical protein
MRNGNFCDELHRFAGRRPGTRDNPLRHGASHGYSGLRDVGIAEGENSFARPRCLFQPNG